MGLFNSGKNDKVEKVSKYERHYNVPESSRRRSSKHRSNQGGESSARAMSQPPMMRMRTGYVPQMNMFSTAMVPGMVPPNAMTQMRYPPIPYDLSKLPSPAPYPFTTAGPMTPMNLSPVWNNGMPFINNRSGFQQPVADCQPAPWPVMPPSNNGYMPPMQF